MPTAALRRLTTYAALHVSSTAAEVVTWEELPDHLLLRVLDHTLKAALPAPTVECHRWL